MSKSGRIVNMEFHTLLRQCRDKEGDRYTLETLANGIQCSRPHLNKVLLNYGRTKWQKFGNGAGGITRKRLVRYFAEHFPDKSEAILRALGWDAYGKIVPHGENHVPQTL